MADTSTTEEARADLRHEDQTDAGWETYDAWARRVDERRIHQTGEGL